MNFIFLFFFIGICLGLVIWGLTKEAGIYQYPFFAGAAFGGYIVPQAIAIVSYPGALHENAIQRVLIMCCLCAVMSWVGYLIPVPRKWLIKAFYFNKNRLALSASIYIIIGLLLVFVLTLINPELAKAEETGGRGGFTGIVTIYLFFSRLLYLGFVIILLQFLRNEKISLVNRILLAVSILLQVIIIITGGRREPLIFLSSSLTLGFYFSKRVVIPRLLIIVGLVMAILFINPITTAQYRKMTELGGDWTRFREVNLIEFVQLLSEIDFIDNLNQFISKSDNLELRNAALQIDSVVKNGGYQWGTGYWNQIIFNWVPAQFLGANFKNSLQFNVGISSSKFCASAGIEYGYDCRTGQTFTGMADAFAQFDYLGCLVFATFAFFFKVLWQRSIYQKDLISQSLYILLIVRSMLSVTHGTLQFPSRVLYITVFLVPILFWSQVSISKRRKPLH